MISYQIIEHGKPLQKVLASTPEPKGSEVLVRITRSGVCHSDLHIWQGYFDWGGGKRFYVKERGCVPPFTLGHEPLGIVEALGPKAKGVKVGQKRLVFPWIGCGKCAVCKAGQDNYCVSGSRIVGVNRNGAYATHVLVPDAKYLVDAAGIDDAFAATLACSGLTAYSASAKLPALGTKDRVAVIGCGGVGLAVIQGARLAGAARIVAVDVLPEKLALADELGATDTVDGSSGQAVAEVRELTDGVDYAFSAITSPAGLVDAVRMCAYAGTATLVGVPPPRRALDVDLELDVFHPKVAIAVTHGGDTIPQQDFPFLAQAALDGRLDLDRFVTKTISLDEVPAALDELHAPKGVRTVVTF
jgi:D-arabinose 1-dehydrogenase-like Zn-dependent alcohol dehydrogenase